MKQLGVGLWLMFAVVAACGLILYQVFYSLIIAPIRRYRYQAGVALVSLLTLAMVFWNAYRVS